MLDERWGEAEQELADGLRGLLEKHGDASVVRAAEAAGDGRSPDLEDRLDDFGLWDLPADAGVLAAAAWELGRALAPIPFPERAALVAVGVGDHVWAEREWAPAVGLDAAFVDPEGRLMGARLGDSQRSVAGDLVARVQPTGKVLAPIGDADRARRLVRLLAAARAVGAAEGALAIGVGYAKERQQFGRPIGAFQAVAHRLADAAIAVDGAALAVRKAAWVSRVEQGGDGAPDSTFAAIARWAAEDAAEAAVAATHQVMGGYGFTVEYDCQLYSRRTRAWRLRLEPVETELAALARRLLTTEGRDASAWLWHHERGLDVPRWAAEADA
ncbi:MAG: acyl-CoA dehydrogenase family protein [Acidimicrobiales bacterium]